MASEPANHTVKNASLGCAVYMKKFANVGCT